MLVYSGKLFLYGIALGMILHIFVFVDNQENLFVGYIFGQVLGMLKMVFSESSKSSGV